MSLPAATDTGAHPDGPPPPPEADAAVAAVRALLIDLHAPADLPGRVTTWALQDGTTRVYVPALPLDVAWRLAALGGAS